MDFKEAAKIASYISKDYAEDIFRLLVAYKDISASEAASRLGMHIKTVQDFMEAMASSGILEKEEVFEKKRPYFRYRLKTKNISMDIDLSPLFDQQKPSGRLSLKIREKKNNGARFSVARNNQYLSSVTIWSGTGRDSKEKKISLSIPQGKFLFHLPFPTAGPLTVEEIMNNAGIGEEYSAEIINIVDELIGLNVIEVLSGDR